MQLIAASTIRILMLSGTAAALLIDIIITKRMVKRFILDINRLLEDGKPEAAAQYASERFFKRLRVRPLLGIYFIYATAFCETTDPRYDEIFGATNLISWRKKPAVLNLVLSAAMMRCLRGETEKARILSEKMKKLPKNKPDPIIQSGLEVCVLLLEDENPFEKIEKYLVENKGSKTFPAFRKSVLLFRQYQLSGRDELLTQSLELAPAPFVHKTLLTIAAQPLGVAYASDTSEKNGASAGKNTCGRNLRFSIAIYVVYVVALFVASFVFGSYYDSPELALDKRIEGDRWLAEYRQIVWYDDSTPIYILADVDNDAYSTGCLRLGVFRIFGQQWWKVRSGPTWTWQDKTANENILDASYRKKVVGDVFIRWGLTTNPGVYGATVNGQTPEVYEATIDGGEYYVWYIFGDESLKTNKIVFE